MPQAAITDRSPQSPPYKRHRPEQTLLYQIIERHYPEFRDVMAMQGKSLPQHVQQEFADYLKCGRLETRLRTHLMKRHKVKDRGIGLGRFPSQQLYTIHGLYRVPTTAGWKKAHALV
jgi:hypothetical protein